MAREGQWLKTGIAAWVGPLSGRLGRSRQSQNAPRFGGPSGNGESEDDRGVLGAYASLGRKNSLPFWLGRDGCQSDAWFDRTPLAGEQVAKMIRLDNSRSDYLGIAFCIGHDTTWLWPIWDYSMGHKPGEAALYTGCLNRRLAL